MSVIGVLSAEANGANSKDAWDKYGDGGGGDWFSNATNYMAKLGGGGPGSVQDMFSGGSASQAAAAAEAQAKQQELIQQLMGQNNAAAQQAVGLIGTGTNQASNEINQGYGYGMGILGDAQQGALGALAGGYGEAAGYAAGGATQANQAIQQGLQGAQGALNPALGLQRYTGDVANGYQASQMQGQDRLGGLLDSGLYSSFEQDPGYQFRKQSGEDAIKAMASANGGMMSGDTLEALTKYNSDLASQEFGNYANRQNALAGQMGASDASQNALALNQAGRNDSAAAAREGALAGLVNTGYGAGNQLAGMQYGAGQAMGGNQMTTAQLLSALSSGYGNAAAGQYGSFGSQMGNMAAQQGQSLGNLYLGSAEAQANALTGAAANNGGLGQSLMPGLMSGVPYANTNAQAFNNLLGLGVSAYSMFGGGGGQGANGDAINNAYGYGGYQDPYGYMY
jgi:hypothetical protein